MQIGIVGLGRMGANMARRLLRKGHQCVVYNRSAGPVQQLVAEGAMGAFSLAELVEKLSPPRVVWLMLPVDVVDATIEALLPHLQRGDVVVDGGNTYFELDIQRARRLAPLGIEYVDCGVSGGVWGLERGYCLMLGGEPTVVQRLEPILAALAPGKEAAPANPLRQRTSSAEHGYLHCGPHGAGHFVKMVHNGIEYGLMAAYAEGFNLLRRACVSKDPAENPESMAVPGHEEYRFNFDLAEIAELWRRGSVIGSWLLDLAAMSLARNETLDAFAGVVGDSGEGRWTIATAVRQGVPVPVLAAALFSRFASRGNAEFANRVLSALRFEFGRHQEPRARTEP
ncbi:MAG: decarboxylating 6-phosphogluconate dehydrogenase [Candidatus Binatia bacterium]|nr:decarboxylating 6-phosphogluconate dehydrogenase [Candidatus Binatia bacterium]